jgi:hypothetical protein
VTDTHTRPAPTDEAPQPSLEQRDAWMRGYLQGHETGAAASTITATTVRQLQAQAWDDGYDHGHTEGRAAERANTTQTLADLAGQHTDIADAFTRISRTTHSQHVANRLHQMQRAADDHHQRHGTTEWAGTANGATPPSADWVPDTNALTKQAEQARAAAPTPALQTWAHVRTAADDRTWHRILADLTAATRAKALRQTSHTTCADLGRTTGTEAA